MEDTLRSNIRYGKVSGRTDCCAVQQAIMPLVAPCRHMEQAAIVPHNEHSRLPFLPVLELRLGLPAINFGNKLPGFS